MLMCSFVWRQSDSHLRVETEKILQSQIIILCLSKVRKIKVTNAKKKLLLPRMICAVLLSVVSTSHASAVNSNHLFQPAFSLKLTSDELRDIEDIECFTSVT